MNNMSYDIFIYHVIPYINDFSIRVINKDIYNKLDKISNICPSDEVLLNLLCLKNENKPVYLTKRYKSIPGYSNVTIKHYFRNLSHKYVYDSCFKLFILCNLFNEGIYNNSNNANIFAYLKRLKSFTELSTINRFLKSNKRSIQINIRNRYQLQLLKKYLERYSMIIYVSNWKENKGYIMTITRIH